MLGIWGFKISAHKRCHTPLLQTVSPPFVAAAFPLPFLTQTGKLMSSDLESWHAGRGPELFQGSVRIWVVQMGRGQRAVVNSRK